MMPGGSDETYAYTPTAMITMSTTASRRKTTPRLCLLRVFSRTLRFWAEGKGNSQSCEMVRLLKYDSLRALPDASQSERLVFCHTWRPDCRPQFSCIQIHYYRDYCLVSFILWQFHV